MSQSIFLARSGLVKGPFSEEQWNKLQSSGDHKKWTWMWREGDAQWSAIDPAPAVPAPFTGGKDRGRGAKSLKTPQDVWWIGESWGAASPADPVRARLVSVTDFSWELEVPSFSLRIPHGKHGAVAAASDGMAGWLHGVGSVPIAVRLISVEPMSDLAGNGPGRSRVRVFPIH